MLVLAMLAVIAAGCSPKPGTSGGGSTPGQPVEVTFWHAMSGQLGKALQAQVDEFNNSQNEVKVTATYQGGYDANQQKLLAAIASGTQPDIAQIEIHALPQFAASKAVMPLDDLMTQSTDHKKEDFLPGVLRNTEYQGKVYGMPFNRSVPVFYYNADMFKQAGLSKPPETWQEVEDYSRKLAQPDKKIYGYEPVNVWWFFESMVWSNGAELMSPDLKQATFNTPEAQAGMELWQRMKREGISNSYSGPDAWSQTIADFAQGRTAMYTGSAGDMGQIAEGAKFEWKAAYIPKFKEYAVPTGGANAAILAKDQTKQQAAWKFISWFTSKDQTITWSQKTGYLPVMKSAVSDPRMVEYFQKNPNHKVPVDQLQYSRTAPEIPQYPQVLKEIQVAQDQIMNNNQPVGPALNEAAQKSNKVVSGS